VLFLFFFFLQVVRDVDLNTTKITRLLAYVLPFLFSSCTSVLVIIMKKQR